jgi:hypothetical protein
LPTAGLAGAGLEVPAGDRIEAEMPAAVLSGRRLPRPVEVLDASSYRRLFGRKGRRPLLLDRAGPRVRM